MENLTLEKDISPFMGGESFLFESRPSYDITSSSTDEDRGLAQVNVIFHLDEGEKEALFICHRRGGTWKISLLETMTAWVFQSSEEIAP